MSRLSSHIYSDRQTDRKNSMLTKKGQSALEYMMTYGWAILIIVIVAVILYSMGIFNPSSSVTFTSSGFSPFIISSSLCNNIGLKIAVNTGPLPGSATSAKITAVYITSATGSTIQSKVYTLSNPITVTPGSVSTILIPAVTCSANGVKYTVSASLQYTTEGTPLPQTLNSTGTIAGTAISGKPSAITSYVPVTVTNAQSTATPTPFQQMINITSSDNGWSDISTSSFGQNVEFFYYNGSVIPSWLESYTSTNAIWWIKLGGIGGGSSKTIYMGFAPTSTNLFNTVNDGEAPQLSSTYGEYDDGANVFNFYDNFAGTSLNTNKWTVSGITYTVDNGFTATATAPSGYIYSSIKVNPGEVIEIYGNLGQQTTDTTAEFGGMLIPAVNGGNFHGVAIGSGWPTAGAYLGQQNGAGTVATVTLTGEFSNAILSIYLKNSTTSLFTYNYGNLVSLSADAPTYPVNLMLIGAPANGAAYTFSVPVTINWYRTRAYPPNGVMPSVAFGSVS